ncbi:NAD(P)H-dependent oxidoreductase [Escherichia coli]
MRADSDYSVKAEVQNFLWADVVIWQMPGWWMGAPWTVKKYIDDVFTKVMERCMPAMVACRKDPSKKSVAQHGTGQKIYAFSNLERTDGSLRRKDQFFHGVGVDGVYLPFHKANQFLGMEPLPTFIANDVIKMPDVPRYTEEYRKHLVEIFG